MRFDLVSGLGRILVVLLMLVLGAAAPATAKAAKQHRGHKSVCAVVPAHQARCLAEVVTQDNTATPLVTSAPAGYGPADLWSAYKLGSPLAPPSGGAGQTIAIVDAYDNPNAERDLEKYRSTYGLSPCTTGNGCFRKVDQSGGMSYPPADVGWAEEISLDLDMASAICPNCHILLVEASSNYFSDLGAAVDRAALMGATQISNSYGGSEYATEVSDQAHFNHPGIDITVSSGDYGYGAEFPASSQYVTAVGGTSLTRNSSARGWAETAWSGSGSGCSAYVPKPSWQADTGCSKRTVADVSAVADPYTGVAVYDTYGDPGWLVFGGTSVASPLVAGVDALAGGRAKSPNSYDSFPYFNYSAFFDVTSGSNGSCSVFYLCNATPGYDGPTGIGTPNGTGAPIAPSPPVNTSPPTISGTPTQNQTLTANPGTWTGSPPPTYAYQWNRCPQGGECAPISPGGTSSTYTLASADVGQNITVTVTATNASGSPSKDSAAVGPVASAPAADFSLSASPSSQSIRRGRSTSYTVTITPLNGFKSAVSLSVAGLPAGVTASFSPVSATTSSTLTVRTSSATPSGTSTLTIKGTSGSLSHSTKVKLQVR
jgi:subtilase family serine protease